jgi:hypothetical protein
MRNRRVLGGVLLLAVAAITAATFLVTREDSEPTRFEAVAEARLAADDKVLGHINGIAVMKADLDENIAAVPGNLVYMREQIAEGGPTAEGLRDFERLIVETGAETVALAGIIVDTSLYSLAVREGTQVSAAEIEERVLRDRAMVEEAGPDFELWDYIEVVGEQRYWDEIYPAEIEREMTVEQFVASRSNPDAAAVEVGKLRNELTREAIATADIALPGDIEAARAYIEALTGLGTVTF